LVESGEPWAKESRFTGKRSVRTNAYTWFARSASLGNRRKVRTFVSGPAEQTEVQNYA